MKWLNNISFPLLLIACLTLGLAPFTPEPHVWEKVKMLLDGSLVKSIDVLDLLMHGAPWVLLGIKTLHQLTLMSKKQEQ